MGPRSSPREMAAAGLRAVAVAFVAVILATTVWVCLVAGTVVLLRPALGQGGALLTVAGGLAALALVARSSAPVSFAMSTSASARSSREAGRSAMVTPKPARSSALARSSRPVRPTATSSARACSETSVISAPGAARAIALLKLALR